MIPKQDLQKALKLAQKYRIGRLYLVGSALDDAAKANDYDFVAENVPAGAYFPFYGELMRSMPKSVDLILLTNDGSRFEKLVREESQLIYEQEKT